MPQRYQKISRARTTSHTCTELSDRSPPVLVPEERDTVICPLQGNILQMGKPEEEKIDFDGHHTQLY
eukprot:SAG22_NODE_21225_length_259_cov_0.606250_1_plen_66_part_10